MKNYIFVGIGGFLGAFIRYKIGEIFVYNGAFPISTFSVNITGAFLFALAIEVMNRHKKLNEHIKTGVTTGFIGAYTTFSTFSKETMLFIKSGDFFYALAYVLMSVVLGVAAFYLGDFFAGKRCMAKRDKNS